jgi:predicted dehydrogenase
VTTPAETPIRTALIGAGFFGVALGRACHSNADLQITAVTDLNEEAGRALATELGAEFEESASALARGGGVDLVLVATPNHAHAAPAIEFLEAGVNVFVEKPLAITLEDTRAIMEAARVSRGRLLVGHVLRTLPGIRRMHEETRGGRLGRLLEGHATRSRYVHLPANTADWWKVDRTRTGGELLHEIHELDLLTWLMGEPVSAICTTGAPLTAGDAVSASVHKTILTFPSDAVGLHEVSTSAHFPEWSVRVSGTEAALVADFRSSTVSRWVDAACVERWDLFNTPEANESLRQSAQQKQAYNRAGAASPVWMSEAIAGELEQVVAAVRGESSVLTAQPDTAVLTALEALETLPREQAHP